MNYELFANATAVTHTAIILVVVAGLLISFRYKRFRPWEAGLLVGIFILWSYYGNCPLTILEQYLREQAGQSVNLTSVGFTTYYLEKLGISISSKIIQNSTFFSGAAFFGASIQWFAPFFHMELFKARQAWRKLFGRKSKRKFA